jgi:biopolymer transport protein ExbB/TolQ
MLMMGITLVMLGTLVVEALTETRRLHKALPDLAKELQTGKGLKATINGSRILRRQKTALVAVIEAPVSIAVRESMAIRAVEKERAYYDRITWVTDVIARLGPAFGLIATLIPLGPGVVALGSGDTATLSSAMLTAFDATVAGLVSSGVSFIISGIRKRIYAGHLSSYELVMEILLDVQGEKVQAADAASPYQSTVTAKHALSEGGAQ